MVTRHRVMYLTIGINPIKMENLLVVDFIRDKKIFIQISISFRNSL